jgi:translation initiation factor 1
MMGTKRDDASSSGKPTERRSLADLRAAFEGRELPSGPTTPSAEHDAPAPKAIRARLIVRRERAGRGGKTVTIAEGPALHGRKLDELARAAAQALGVGARVEASTIVVQGDQTERFIAWFEKQGFASITRGN